MAFYSFCANIPDDPRAKDSAQQVSIARLVTEPQYREDMRRKYAQIVSSPTSVGPLFQVSTGDLITRTINVQGPVFRVLETIERSPTPLGGGAFGVVRLGTLVEHRHINFALKSFKELDPNKWNSTKEYIFEEIKSYARLDHENIIKFYGVLFTNTETRMEIMMEAMNKGSLWTWLNFEDDPVPDATQLHIALQLARGLEYMSARGFVHCDIAARNCLLHEHDGQLVAKIGDMGLTRKLYTKKYYKRQSDVVLTIRWMSPENIETNKFSTKSDCWAFGVMLWEIATGCKRDPYAEFGHLREESQLARIIIEGQTMSKPARCPQQLYDIMLGCWVRNPYMRWTIERVRTQLETLAQSATGACRGHPFG